MKKVISMLVCITLFATLLVMPISAEQPISVYVNGEKLEFDVAPVLLNNRTMVPMRKIFETLGASVSWNGDTETASGVRNGVRVSVSIDNPKASIDGKTTTLDQSPVLLDGRTLVPLRFIAEAYGAKVEWVDETQTVNISTEELDAVVDAYYIHASDFTNLGGWVLEPDGKDSFLFGSHGSPDGAAGTVPGGANATADFSVKNGGTYKVWTLARDYAKSSPGARYYNVGVDGTMVPEKMGTHGKEGFHWQEVGVYNFEANSTHTISVHDTSGYYARCKAFFITNNLSEAPSDDLEHLSKYFTASAELMNSMPDYQFPHWATQPMQEQEVITLENDTFQINFIQGVGSKGNLVQNEIFVKKDGAWVKVKDKSEQFGYLMMNADATEKAVPRVPGEKIGHHEEGETFTQSFVKDDTDIQYTTENFFETGVGYWFIPDAMQKVSDNEVQLFFPAKDCATLSVTVSLDDLVKEPKFKLDAAFSKDGAYSFLLFSGDAIDESKISRSVVPFIYTRKGVPETTNVISEPFMFTPMVAFEAKEDALELVQGIVIDPSTTYQDVAYWETARYGYLLRDKENNVRAQITAPLMGTPGANFKAGDTYSIAYRVLAGTDGWYNTFKHVSEDIYNVKDIRTNYYGSLNDAVYNIDDLILDDKYSGWDDNSMGFYYAERDHQAGQCNTLQLVQRYLMTEDETILDERAVPTIAFMLSRKENHFNYDLTDTSVLGSNELDVSPTIGDAAQWTALYEMSQGRMPYALQTAINKGAANIPAKASYYNMTGDSRYLNEIKTSADKLVAMLDDETFNTGAKTTGFVLNDYSGHIPNLMYAYQLTGEQKYLDAAEQFSQMLMTALSSMGYQNGYADNMYHVDPQTAADIHVINADNSEWWWHGDFQWRIENEYGTWKPAMGMTSVVDEDDAPGWTFATVGLTTEHTFTAGHSNFILMNTWAPFMYKMSDWTGDNFFETQGRNAILGRFTNYPGYYIERYYTDYMKPQYPYEGPEYNILYYTHVAPFQAIVEDFQIQEVMSRSDGKIEFPEIWAGSYSYFNSNQYGAKPGKMYDEEGMWLNNERDIVKSSDVNVNYVAAKKDGTFGVALVNESKSAVSSDITLGGALSGYNGAVALYSKDGTKTETTATNGIFNVNIPAKGIVTVIVKSSAVQKPQYALNKILYNPTIEKTQTSHINGKGYVIQLNPEKYHAYVYVTDKDIQSLTVEYEANGEKATVTDDKYPFEAIVKVNSGSAEFKYNLTATKADGSTADYGQGVLAPISNGPETDNIKDTIGNKVVQPEVIVNYPEISKKISANYKQNVPVNRVGSTPKAGSTPAKLRFVTKASDYNLPVAMEVGLLGGLYVRGTLTHKDTQEALNFETRALTNEGTETVVLVIVEPAEFSGYTIDDFKASNLEVSAKPFEDKLPEPKKPLGATTIEDETETTTDLSEFKDGEYRVSNIGGMKGAQLRIALSYKDLGFTPAENQLKGLYVRGELKAKDGSKSVPFSGTVLSNDVRDTDCVIPVDFILPDEPAVYSLLKVELSKTPFEGQQENSSTEKEESDAAPTDFAAFTVKAANTGSNAQGFRVVVDLKYFPFAVKNGTLQGYPAHIKVTDKEGKILELDVTIQNSEERADGQQITIVLPLAEFDGKINMSGAKAELTISPKQ